MELEHKAAPNTPCSVTSPRRVPKTKWPSFPPIVDHAVERKRSLAVYEALRRNATSPR
jgi:hypothetical protein